jgi:hypothetical protein
MNPKAASIIIISCLVAIIGELWVIAVELGKIAQNI